MEPRYKRLIIGIIFASGLLFTASCGQEGGYGPDGSNNVGPIDGGVTVSNTVQSPKDMGVGDIFMVTFERGESSTVDFEGVSSDAEFVLSVVELDGLAGDYVAQLMDEDVMPEIAAKAEVVADTSYDLDEEEYGENWSVDAAFDQQLRNQEMVFAYDYEGSGEELDEAPVYKAAVAFKEASVGSQESFRVMNSISNMSSYTNVSAEVKCVTSNVDFYVDTSVSASDLTNEDINNLCQGFDNAVAIERGLLGEESDVNGDHKIQVLLTPEINKLGGIGGGIITGFFYAGDIHPRSSSNQLSNEREIIYALVPDPTGKYGVAIPKVFALKNLLPAVLPHEFQHAISYNQHVIIGRGKPEENWLNEAMSHLAEDLTGYGFENPSRVDIFLKNTSRFSLISGKGTPNLGERGAGYLFLRFLYEQAGDGRELLWNLEHSAKIGVVNIEESFAGLNASFDQFGEFLLRWAVAVAVTNQGVTQDQRYVYREREWNEDAGYWEGTCLLCDPEDGRGTVLAGVKANKYSGVDQVKFSAGGSKYFDVSEYVPDHMTFKGVSNGTFGAVLVRTK